MKRKPQASAKCPLCGHKKIKSSFWHRRLLPSRQAATPPSRREAGNGAPLSIKSRPAPFGASRSLYLFFCRSAVLRPNTFRAPLVWSKYDRSPKRTAKQAKMFIRSDEALTGQIFGQIGRPRPEAVLRTARGRGRPKKAPLSIKIATRSIRSGLLSFLPHSVEALY